MTLTGQKQDRSITVSVTPELEQFVSELLESGKFSSASEVVCEGLRSLQDRYIVYQARLAELQKEITIGIEASEGGEVVDGATAIQELRDKIRQRSSNGDQ
ncbi:type II toxin-antitoxin system ParD family antitoxin [Coleofasciculus sp. H7-2]|uniref:type II toxin-antitoxin system ParD family antitoxin n=1 Tax=Coleofasciculus sp. H7-2 TaxID=3351545 RepID=UPI00366F1C10